MTGWPLHTNENTAVASTRARLCVPVRGCRVADRARAAAAFAAGAIGLVGWAGVGSGWTVAFVVLALLYAVAGLVEFEVGTLDTDCSLAALAAMFVSLPPAVIPWCVAAGAALRAVFTSRAHPHVSAIVPAVASVASPVLAPAVTIAALGPATSWSDGLVLGAALVAYIAADIAVSTVFARLAFGVPLSFSAGDVWVYAVDLLLAPLGFALGFAADGRPLGPRNRVPPAGAAPSGLRAGAPVAGRPGARAHRPTAEPRCCSATSSRPTTPTRARTAATSSSSRSRSADGWARRRPRATSSSPRCCTTSARSRCQGDHQQAGQARPTRSGR